MDSEPTHALPPDLVAKLVEAKDWSRRPPGRDSIRHQREWQAEGAHLLLDVVEIIDETWGFAVELPKADA